MANFTPWDIDATASRLAASSAQKEPQTEYFTQSGKTSLQAPKGGDEIE
ncbi:MULTISPECIES: hypothetical protein [Agrobacterium]|uniref:Uncharacterized protein n=1 Tax=Agrobacterium burrii TaxID=2815339 RepID=A0ABS3EPT6_9HYPH|nr:MULTISPECIES: hypothetical protein [Agrobacterium]MBO0133944.1 hypothetical protein [Agrobacterium burrii]